MVDLVPLQSVSYVAATIGVMVATIYYLVTLRNSTKTRQTQLFMQLFDRWGDPTFAKMYGDYRYRLCAEANNDPREICKIAVQAQYGSFNPDFWVPIHALAQYFEGISILVQDRLIDVNMVGRLLSGRIIWYRDSTESFVKYVRERVSDSTMYSGLESLANEMKRRKGI